ncbi:TetR/AcrR family transcriptional regulator [Dietzia massiliensis]|uniref:TetR/AcrR family transcriptional regulator n=1 Tax=Dietzia massiliensis TaxID=2697499 RepID=UPI001BCBDA52|nr:TetR/AcrR family transcriptional regulator [Dietzia massiliensis]MBS7546701.1 TetR/AcrR family transcriptional regulator [Dietzia massiliensis]
MGRRAEARAETTERILGAARAEIARVGGVGLSMRAVAREVGMVSSAVYRYFPAREDLLTAMIMESYANLADALAAAADHGDAASGAAAGSGVAVADRWSRLATALRRWGLATPHEFQLIYGTPIPGYVAPPETIPAAGAVAAPFLDCVGPRRVAWTADLRSGEGLRALVDGTGMDSSGAAAVVAAISELVGFVGHELAGHFVGMFEPADGLYDAVVARQVRDLGLNAAPRGEF